VTDKPTVHEALAAVMGEVQAVRKADRNTQQGYNFRGIDAVVNAVGPALRAHGVVILPVAEDVMVEHFTTKKETQMRGITLRIRWRIYGPAGDSIEAVTYGEAADSGDKAVPKAHSVAYRTMLLQALCIPTDEPDPDSQSYERAEAAEPDPRMQLQRDIKTLADDLGWSVDEVLTAFDSDYDKDIRQGTVVELRAFLDWLSNQPSKWESNPVGDPA
jgi:hypothetical protein